MDKHADRASHTDNEVTIGITPPSRYKVILHNDNYTTMDFVIDVLEKYFSHSPEKAIEIMLAIHHKNKGICGIYSAEVAETKVALVNDYAKMNHYPLLCTMEKE